MSRVLALQCLSASVLLVVLGAGCGVTSEAPTLDERCAFYSEYLQHPRAGRGPGYAIVADRYDRVCRGRS